MKQPLLVLAPLRVESAALAAEPGWHVIRSGMGPARARIAAARGLAVEDATAVAVVGLCAAVAPGLAAGDVVCGTELRRNGADPIGVPAGALLADAVHRHGLRAHTGPIYSTDHIASPQERRRLEGSGAIAIDMESAWLAEAAAGRSLAILRVVVETAGRRLADPRTIRTGIRALVNLRRACPALAEWAGAAAATTVPERDVPEPVARELVTR